MDFALIGFFTSALIAFVLHQFFKYEEKNGVRVGARIRSHADFFVIKAEHTFHRMLRFVGMDFIRQILHYFFHTVLNATLVFLKRCEQGLRNVKRVNKTIAKSVEQESELRSKLEEIALHKVATALSEEEKKEHREKMLNGM